jgi:hypothetical protein
MFHSVIVQVATLISMDVAEAAALNRSLRLETGILLLLGHITKEAESKDASIDQFTIYM